MWGRGRGVQKEVWKAEKRKEAVEMGNMGVAHTEQMSRGPVGSPSRGLRRSWLGDKGVLFWPPVLGRAERKRKRKGEIKRTRRKHIPAASKDKKSTRSKSKQSKVKSKNSLPRHSLTPVVTMS